MQVWSLNITGLNFFETKEINKKSDEKNFDQWKNITEEIKNFWWKILNTFLWIENKTQENLINKAAFEDKIKQEPEEKIKQEFKKVKEEKNYYLNLNQEKKDEIINWDDLVEKMKLASAWIKNLESFQ